MKYISRSSFKTTTNRALRKCYRMYANGVAAYCTPYEYISLCYYFKNTHSSYYLDLVSKGRTMQTWHYFKINKFDKVYPTHTSAMLNVYME